MISTEQVYKSNDDAIKRLLELSKPELGELDFHVDGSVWKNGKLIAERITEEQEEWVERRMHGSARSWERWFVGQYFTEEQKKELGLTDKDIAGRGMA
jgi:hypothetical protein